MSSWAVSVLAAEAKKAGIAIIIIIIIIIIINIICPHRSHNLHTA